MTRANRIRFCECPYCKHFSGMHSAKECCDHVKKFHIREVTEWLKNGPDGDPRLGSQQEQNLRDNGVDPVCWAAGLIMCA